MSQTMANEEKTTTMSRPTPDLWGQRWLLWTMNTLALASHSHCNWISSLCWGDFRLKNFEREKGAYADGTFAWASHAHTAHPLTHVWFQIQKFIAKIKQVTFSDSLSVLASSNWASNSLIRYKKINAKKCANIIYLNAHFQLFICLCQLFLDRLKFRIFQSFIPFG